MHKLETYQLAVAAAIGMNAPKEVKKLDPEYRISVPLEDVHPILRPVRN